MTLQRAAQSAAQLRFIVDHENARSAHADALPFRRGEGDDEARPRGRTFDAHRAAAERDEALHDREAKAAALHATTAFLRAVEALEHVWEILRRDARPRILDDDLD